MGKYSHILSHARTPKRSVPLPYNPGDISIGLAAADFPEIGVSPIHLMDWCENKNNTMKTEVMKQKVESRGCVAAEGKDDCW
jgi:hypothetical protein